MSKYEVAIVTTLTKVALAVEALLDGEVETYKNFHDPNIYTLGRMGKYFVVVATLFEGVYGANSAASVVKDLLRTFTSVKHVLVVGIAGGVPNPDDPERDVRLGDIVVSTKGGYVQWDFGKMASDKEFENRSLNILPSAELLAAIANLKRHWARKGRSLNDFIKQVTENIKANGHLYKRPQPGWGKLFKATYIHDSKNNTTETDEANCVGDPTDFRKTREKQHNSNNS